MIDLRGRVVYARSARLPVELAQSVVAVEVAGDDAVPPVAAGLEEDGAPYWACEKVMSGKLAMRPFRWTLRT